MVSKFNILKVVFLLLVVITVFELIYYFYIGYSKINPNLNNRQLTNTDKQNQYTIESSGESALEKNTLLGLYESSSQIPKDVLKKYQVKVQLEGILEEADVQKEPPYLFRIKGNDGGIHQFIYPEDSPSQTSVLTIVGANGEKMNITDLKVNDPVNMTIDMDLTDSKTGQTKINWLITKL